MKIIHGYLTEMPPASRVHARDYQALHFHPDGNYPWSAPRSPAEDTSKYGRSAREWYACQYCSSMHPQDLAAAIRLGATVSWADFKYGWPHKVYVDRAPNRYEGELEVRWWGPDGPGPEEPAKAVTWGKFYTVHLQDATPEDRLTIQRAMGLMFEFQGDHLRWSKFAEPVPA